jgi:predicted transcriptional regulator
MQEALQGVTVSDLISRNTSTVYGLTTLQRLVDEHMLSNGQPYVLVGEGGDLRGVLTLQDITALPARKWPFTTAADAMSPVSQLVSIPSQKELWQTLQFMERKGISKVAVEENGETIGVLTQEQIQQYLRMRSRLGL